MAADTWTVGSMGKAWEVEDYMYLYIHDPSMRVVRQKV